jgi:hypothetical protein
MPPSGSATNRLRKSRLTYFHGVPEAGWSKNLQIHTKLIISTANTVVLKVIKKLSQFLTITKNN